MTFSSTASLISTDLDNTLRGLYRDNADHSVTGTTAETTLGIFTITGGTMGATGMVEVVVSGTISGTNNTKTLKFYFGASLISNHLTRNAGSTADWVFRMQIYNSSATTQRIVRIESSASASTMDGYVQTASENTAADVVVKVTGTLANGSDTITQSTMNAFICQIQ